MLQVGGRKCFEYFICNALFFGQKCTHLNLTQQGNDTIDLRARAVTRAKKILCPSKVCVLLPQLTCMLRNSKKHGKQEYLLLYLVLVRNNALMLYEPHRKAFPWPPTESLTSSLVSKLANSDITFVLAGVNGDTDKLAPGRPSCAASCAGLVNEETFFVSLAPVWRSTVDGQFQIGQGTSSD